MVEVLDTPVGALLDTISSPAFASANHGGDIKWRFVIEILSDDMFQGKRFSLPSTRQMSYF